MRSNFRRLRRFRCRTTQVLAVVLALASCAPPPAPPQATVLPEPPPSTPVRPVRPVLHAAWSFQATPEACIAQAKAGPASLSVAIRQTGPIRLTLTLPVDPPDQALARFSGPAGSWDIRAAAIHHHGASFILPRTDTSLGRILILLSGGQLIPEQTEAPILSLPESGAAGRHWFGCARYSVNGA